MKKLFTLFCLVICLTNLKAQYITITDTAFVNWLQTNIPSAMNGNQMDTTSLAITTRTNVELSSGYIADINSIKYFTALKKLDCSLTSITSIPILNAPLEYLNTLNSLITNFSPLPNTLKYFNCKGNPIDSLPSLPSGLEILICGSTPLINLPILPNSLRILDCSSFFGSLSNISSFPSLLDSIDISGNNIGILPTLPSNLKKLNCGNNALTSLPSLPNGLLKLDYTHNNITIFPNFPSTLLYLNCSGNYISGATPTLPNSLIEFNCNSNAYITSISSLPSSLVVLRCGVNNLTSLPALPSTLQYLDFQVNHITSLPALPNSLENLIGWQNQLTSLPALPSNLKGLSCSSNNLTSLPILPNSLTALGADYNQITLLPTIPPNLHTLSVKHNLLDSIPVLPNTLISLEISYNNISQITSFPSSLSSFWCSHNQLTQLPIIPNTVTGFDCSYNQLTQLPTLPPFLFGITCNNNSIICIPSLPSSLVNINILNNSFTCLPNHLPYMDAATLAYPICVTSNTLTNPNNCNVFQGIEGNTYNDADLDCIKTYDQYATNIQLKLYDNNNNYLGSTNSFGTGIYNFAESAGNYKVVVDTLYRPYAVICSTPGVDSSATLTSTVTNINNVNFALNCKTGFDIGVQSITTSSLVFPGQTHTLTVMAGDMYRWYNMNCSYGISGTVSFSVNGPVTYISPAPGALTPTIAGNLYTYSIADFGTINNSAAFGLIFSVDTSANVNDVICVNATVTPIAGENNPINNTETFCYNIVNSLDPNIKEVYPIDVLPAYYDWLTYTIHFQNTGNAPAINIHLADTLDNMLDLETFQVINYSHYNQTHLNGNVLDVNFPNIQLSDSSSNPAGSIGYIQYRIKPKSTWSAPYKIKNTAYIYFDYNAPIVTNTTYNSILTSTDIRNQTENSSVIYPNPSNGNFIIELNNKEKQHLQLFDMAGNVVLSQSIENGKGMINANYLPAGVYNLKITSNGSVINKKLVIVK